MQSLTDTIDAARRGDRKAFAALMERFQDRAFAVALAQLGNYHQAQDAVQEAFVEAYLRLGQLQASDAFPAWLNKIVQGKCVRVLRTGKSVPAALPIDSLMDVRAAGPTPEMALLEQTAQAELQKALGRLSEQEREALVLFSVGGYRYAEIAALMDLPLALIRKRIYTARQQLRSAEELAFLRPSQREGAKQDVSRRVAERVALRKEAAERESAFGVRKEEKMEDAAAKAALQVDIVGPGAENRTAVKNLYTFYRYDLLMTRHYPPSEDGGITPPPSPDNETWRAGAWVNQHGVIDGLHSLTHEDGVRGEDVFWEWPNLQAFLIRLNGWPAGFALVASPPNATRGVDYRLQEFFVLNKARRLGVGSEAARLLFDRLPGRWEIAYDPHNEPAAAFWRRFIPAYTNGDCAEEMIGMGGDPDLPGYVFTRGERPTHPIRVR